jgi:hypothetical protein
MLLRFLKREVTTLRKQNVHIVRVGDLRATIRRLPARPGSMEHRIIYSRLCGKPRRWRRVEQGTVLTVGDSTAYRRLYAEATKWSRDAYLAYQDRRKRRLSTSRCGHTSSKET